MAKTLKQDTFAFRYVVQEAKALYYFHFLEDKNPRQDQLRTWQTQNDDYESSQLFLSLISPLVCALARLAS